MSTEASCVTQEGWPIIQQGYRLRIPFKSRGRQDHTSVHLGNSPLPDEALFYLLEDSELRTGGTIEGEARRLAILGEWLRERGLDDVTPPIFSDFLAWLRAQVNDDGSDRFGVSDRDSHASAILSMYEANIGREGSDWSHLNLSRMRRRRKTEFRGSTKQGVLTAQEKAISLETFNDLSRAITLEFLECRQVLDEYRQGRRESLLTRGILEPNPFVVFALSAATRVGLRSEEFNYLNVGDVEEDPRNGSHELYVHAPNKDADYIPIDDALLEAIRLCEAWSEEVRGEYTGKRLLAYLARMPKRTAVEVNSYVLSHRMLPRFYQKYHGRMIEDDGERRPLLHAEHDPDLPFACGLRKLRNAFAVRLNERERNVDLVQAIMRHRRRETTERSYLVPSRLDHARKVAVALGPEANAFVMGLRHSVALGISDETVQRAIAQGGAVPYGACRQALEEDRTCRRSGNCMECPMLVVLADRDGVIEADQTLWLNQAQELERQADPRGAENLRRRASLAQATLVQIRQRTNGRRGKAA